VTIAAGFVYLAAILDAWSRRVVGYGISRSMDARLSMAAPKAAIRARRPGAGCVHHSDRGSQYASAAYRKILEDRHPTGRRPDDKGLCAPVLMASLQWLRAGRRRMHP
jgi:putative transposase